MEVQLLISVMILYNKQLQTLHALNIHIIKVLINMTYRVANISMSSFLSQGHTRRPGGLGLS